MKTIKVEVRNRLTRTKYLKYNGEMYIINAKSSETILIDSSELAELRKESGITVKVIN